MKQVFQEFSRNPRGRSEFYSLFVPVRGLFPLLRLSDFNARVRSQARFISSATVTLLFSFVGARNVDFSMLPFIHKQTAQLCLGCSP